MKNNRKGYEVFEETISPDNVMRMGELLALQSLKFMCGHKQSHIFMDTLPSREYQSEFL